MEVRLCEGIGRRTLEHARKSRVNDVPLHLVHGTKERQQRLTPINILRLLLYLLHLPRQHPLRERSHA